MKLKDRIELQLALLRDKWWMPHFLVVAIDWVRYEYLL